MFLSMARSSGRLVALGNGSPARNSVHLRAAVTVDGQPLRLPAGTADEGSARNIRCCKTVVGDALSIKAISPSRPDRS
jgi:hypothetical protein